MSVHGAEVGARPRPGDVDRRNGTRRHLFAGLAAAALVTVAGLAAAAAWLVVTAPGPRHAVADAGRGAPQRSVAGLAAEPLGRPSVPPAVSVVPGRPWTARSFAVAGDAGPPDEGPGGTRRAPSPAIAPAAPGAPAGRPAAMAAVDPTGPAVPATVPNRAPALSPPLPEPAGPVEPTVRLDRPLGVPGDDLDARIEQAIRRGAQRLLDAPGTDVGRSVLAVYALAAAGQAVDDPRLGANGSVLAPLLEKLKGTGLTQTYHRAIRACALAVHNRPRDKAALAADVAWLIAAAGGEGSYTYQSKSASPGPRSGRGGPGARRWDNSNSQYGLLGVWAGAEAGVEVPGHYWAQVERHWRSTQAANGQWPYTTYGPRTPETGTFTMTCAGVVSTTITHDYLHAGAAVGRFAAAPMPPSLGRALDWLDRSADQDGLNVSLGGYAVYGLERVGLATGIKYFGKHDWYRELAEQVVAAQQADGGWGGARGDVVETSFCVLFLSRGRHPVLLNKLRYGGDGWYNRPWDAANVARFTSRAAERPLNWQVVNLDRPGTDWLDAPILYIPGDRPVRFAAADYDRFRAFARAGGLIFLHADGGSPTFADWARREFAPRVWPDGPLVPLPADHGLMRLAAKLPPGTRLEAAGNGSRLAVVLSPDDVAGAWQARDDKAKRAAFDVMLNLFVYATDNVPPRNRLVSPVVPDPPAGRPLATFPVARVRHAGDWDPEPEAWPRFATLFRWQTGAAADVRAATAEELGRRGAAGAGAARPPLAHLTGTAPFPLSVSEAAGLRAYVEGGGVLLVEACGGSGAFATFADETLLPTAFPGLTLVDATPDQAPLAKTQPVTDDLTKRKVRPFAVGQPAGRLCGLRKGRWGKGWVLVSRYDLTTGLLGSNVWGVVGFSPDYCVGVVKNVLVWAATMRGGPAVAGELAPQGDAPQGESAPPPAPPGGADRPVGGGEAPSAAASRPAATAGADPPRPASRRGL